MIKKCEFFIHYKNGCCENDQIFETDVQMQKIKLYRFSEDGTLSEAIKEGFNHFGFNKLKQALKEAKISKKKQAEIMKIFDDELDDALIHWTESIDEIVSRALNNFESDLTTDLTTDVIIKNPAEFYCTEYM